MSDYRYLETSGLRATEVAATLRALESYTPAGVGTDVLFEPFNNLAAWTVAGAATIQAGRTGTACRTVGSSANYAFYSIPSINQSDTVTIGCAFRWTDANTLAQRDILRLYSDTGATEHNRLTIASTGSVAFFRGATSIGTSATGLMVANTWYYVELQIRLHDTAGTVEVRINSTPVIAATTLDTKNAGTKTVYDQVRIGGLITGATHFYDDLYITTGAGAPFKGDITIP